MLDHMLNAPLVHAWHIKQYRNTPRTWPFQLHVSNVAVIIVVGQLCIFTSLKRSLGQGNVFTHVCHSVHEGRESMYDVTSCLAAWSHVPSRGYLSLDPPGQRWTETPLSRTIKSGRYTSYWNAFLFENWTEKNYHSISDFNVELVSFLQHHE